MPAIQRDYEWSYDRIQWLFDSLMRDYPVSSFLFWDVRGTDVGDYKFYSFLRDYRETFQVRGEERPVNSNDHFQAVLDGQQRLTSLYIGFYGSFAWRIRNGRWNDDNETSRPTRKLYLNITNELKPEDDEQGRRFDFQFKTNLESANFSDIFTDSSEIQWFRVGKILDLTSRNAFSTYVNANNINQASQIILGTLADMVERRSINYYLEEDHDLQKALNIFIRINKGGAQISVSTIILSMAISFWHGDAKMAFDRLRATVAQEGFNIDNDFILKAFLYLHSQDIKFNVKNFKRETAELMEGNWERLANSIIETFRTITRFGYNEPRLPAKNVLMPIIYYIYHRNVWNGFSQKIGFSDERKVICKWLHNAVVHKIVGGSSDAILSRIRHAFTTEIANPLAVSGDMFPALKIRGILNAEMAVSDEFLEEIVHLQKDDRFAFHVLALLFPHLDYRNSFHKDHMHPETFFHNCDIQSIPMDEREYFTNPHWWNSIVNLQMLDGVDNESKQGKLLNDWMAIQVQELHKDKAVMFERCIIPDGISLDFKQFPLFAKARKQLLKERLRQILS